MSSRHKDIPCDEFLCLPEKNPHHYEKVKTVSSRSIRNANVCVTGGCGFLGSHMVKALIEERGCNVMVIDNLCAGRREFLHHKAKLEHADITTSESYLLRLFRHYQTQYVFCYAASPYVPMSFERPAHVCMTNFVGAMNTINAAHEAGVTGILQVSSAEIYGEDQNQGSTNGGHTTWTGNIKENFPVTPHSSYGASKAAIDFYVQCRWWEAGVPCIALRQFNCLGERETHPYVVPEIISQLFHVPPRNGGLSVRLGNNSVRDFLYAGDAVRTAVELLEKGQFGDVYNLGSERGVKIYDLAQMCANAVNAGRIHIVEDDSRRRPKEIWHLQSDNAKINRVVESRPVVTLEQAIEKTVNWYLHNGKKWCWEK